MRSFIALPVDSQTKATLEQKVNQLKSLPWSQSIRWYPPNNYHLTLMFLGGHLHPETVQAVKNSMKNWFAEGMSFFEAELIEIQAFPNRQKPKALVVSLDATLLMQYLVREIEDHVKPLGLTRSKQAFRPHISLGKISTTLQPEKLVIPQKIKSFPHERLTVDRLTLFESTMTDSFPIYTPLQTIFLERY
ncbi:MAG: RNA 2',3'-cyclic phosphodiesterase [Pseudomonadota bacterium]|nr:RNA 2',3'-cyclic phosphodiesterase [Pseudomonadota bacterium]